MNASLARTTGEMIGFFLFSLSAAKVCEELTSQAFGDFVTVFLAHRKENFDRARAVRHLTKKVLKFEACAFNPEGSIYSQMDCMDRAFNARLLLEFTLQHDEPFLDFFYVTDVDALNNPDDKPLRLPVDSIKEAYMLVCTAAMDPQKPLVLLSERAAEKGREYMWAFMYPRVCEDDTKDFCQSYEHAINKLAESVVFGE